MSVWTCILSLKHPPHKWMNDGILSGSWEINAKGPYSYNNILNRVIKVDEHLEAIARNWRCGLIYKNRKHRNLFVYGKGYWLLPTQKSQKTERTEEVNKVIKCLKSRRAKRRRSPCRDNGVERWFTFTVLAFSWCCYQKWLMRLREWDEAQEIDRSRGEEEEQFGGR